MKIQIYPPIYIHQIGRQKTPSHSGTIAYLFYAMAWEGMKKAK